MSSKGAKAPAKGKKPAGKEEKSEDTLKAVILADYFQDRFVPFTLEKPRCLLTLANVPLIDYTLEFLDLNNVQEVIIYTSNHTDQIESYIHDHPRWSPTSKINPFSAVDLIRVSDASSVGDFLRDLDSKSLVSGDFILVHGDCVSNIQLAPVLAKHKARREANREAIMTIVLKESGSKNNRTSAKAITPIFAVDSSNGRVLHYEEMNPLQNDHYAMLDPYVFEHDAVEIRADLIDPGIDICTPDALALWSESFDYELPRKNFLHGVLKDWELNGKFIYTEIMEEGYAARATNLQMYDAIAQDVIDRITFPIVPDSDLVQGQTYLTQQDGVLRERGVEIESDAVVSRSILGTRTSVGYGAKIKNSTIGRRCFIGPNVTIEDSYIWDDATIESGAVVTRSVIGGSATVGKNCRIGAGSLVSFDVMISDNVTIPPATVLSLMSHDHDIVKSDLQLLGPRGKGAIFKYEEDEEEDIDPNDPAPLQQTLIYSVEAFNISTSSVSTLSSEISTDSEPDNSDDNDDPNARETAHTRLSSFASDDSSASQAALYKQKALFHLEAVNGLLDALRSDAADFNNAKIEFTSLRAAENASDSSMRRAVAAAFVQRGVELVTEEGLKPAKAAERAINDKPGAIAFIRAVGVGAGSVEEQVEFALSVQRGLVKHLAKGKEVGFEAPQAGTLMAALLQHMYNADIFEEAGVLAWWGDARGKEGETLSAVRERCQVLIDWLEEDSEEESDEDDVDSD